MHKVNIFWFRRDLRLYDNAGLCHALKSNNPVLPVFIFDKNILSKLEDKSDRRVNFIHTALDNIQNSLVKLGSSLEIIHADPAEAFNILTDKYQIENVFTNHDYEPYARERDSAIAELLISKEVLFHSFKDQVIFEKDEVLKDDANPYTIFTPYSRKWKTLLTDHDLGSFPAEKYYDNFFKKQAEPLPILQSIGFSPVDMALPSKIPDEQKIIKYRDQRNFPAVSGTSKLSVHLRFGTISIRQLTKYSKTLSETYLNELIWRDFYQMILWHFPDVGNGKAFKSEYDNIEWRRDVGEFERWCNGQTGYPIVDAGMRELNATGFMHNRVRMIVASFLCKHLLLDWRLGEAYFAEKLLDFDLAANNGGWQWAAGSGCDAAPYFRIFNPYLQTKKFDPELEYIKKWIPELNESNYPVPVVEHQFARKRCLEVYSKAIRKR